MNAATLANSGQRNKPFGHTAIGVFLLFGATMASYAAVTMAWPGTILDRGWMLNPAAHQQLATLGRVLAFPFMFLALALFLAGLGWFRRRRWGWALAIILIGINFLGNLFTVMQGQWLKGAVGVVVAGLLLIYITRSQMRDYFQADS